MRARYAWPCMAGPQPNQTPLTSARGNSRRTSPQSVAPGHHPHTRPGQSAPAQIDASLVFLAFPLKQPTKGYAQKADPFCISDVAWRSHQGMPHGQHVGSHPLSGQIKLQPWNRIHRTYSNRFCLAFGFKRLGGAPENTLARMPMRSSLPLCRQVPGQRGDAGKV